MTERQQFYDMFADFLLKTADDRELPQPQPDTHLWLAGYLDSFIMLEAVSFLEQVVGHGIELRGDFLPNFFTMRGIYDSYVADGLGVPGAP